MNANRVLCEVERSEQQKRKIDDELQQQQQQLKQQQRKKNQINGIESTERCRSVWSDVCYVCFFCVEWMILCVCVWF